MKTFWNTKFTKRNYECTNIVACVATEAPAAHWQECDAGKISGLMQIEIVRGVRYFGWM